MSIHTVYFAGPLFTQAERNWNTAIAEGLQDAGFEVLLPQIQAINIVKSTGGLTKEERKALFDVAIDSVNKCDAVIAILDGPDPDSGTCFECGYALGLNRPVLGIRTDLRFGGDDPDAGVNLMLSQSCQKILSIGLDILTEDVPYVVKLIRAQLSELT
jgi:nucleoside 2-deoxyribosyltransferase